MKTDLPTRDNNGRLPAFAWPGGYPVMYLFADGAGCCAACANGANGSEARVENAADDDPNDGWHVVGYWIHYEGEPARCEHCGSLTPSAYGDPTGRCEGCGEDPIHTDPYIVTGHDGTVDRGVMYCEGCADLARADWNGNTAGIETL